MSGVRHHFSIIAIPAEVYQEFYKTHRHATQQEMLVEAETNHAPSVIAGIVAAPTAEDAKMMFWLNHTTFDGPPHILLIEWLDTEKRSAQ